MLTTIIRLHFSLFHQLFFQCQINAFLVEWKVTIIMTAFIVPVDIHLKSILYNVMDVKVMVIQFFLFRIETVRTGVSYRSLSPNLDMFYIFTDYVHS